MSSNKITAIAAVEAMARTALAWNKLAMMWRIVIKLHRKSVYS